MILDYLGKFHPLLVHLPIGMVVLALLFKLMSRVEKWESLKEVLPLVLFVSFLTALATTTTGYLLSLSGDYDPTMTDRHQWSAISLTVLLGLMTVLVRKGLPSVAENVLWFLLAFLLTAAGHLGGSITHGEDYLSFLSQKYERPVIASVEQAHIYKDLITPILAENCYSCHSSKKQKAQLRLDDPEFILKGSEEGEVIDPGDPNGSLLVENLLLAELDEKHMPPKGRPQPTEKEIEMIKWWVEIGAPFDQKMSDAPENASIAQFVQNIIEAQGQTRLAWIPEIEIEPASPEAIKQLSDSGIVVIPVAANSNYLSVNFLEKSFKNAPLLAPLAEHIIWLKVGNTGMTDDDAAELSKLTNLMILHLDGNPLGDEGMVHLVPLKELTRLSVTGTNVSAQGVEQLHGLDKLQRMYLYQTKVSATDLPVLQKAFPNTALDIGGHELAIDVIKTSGILP